MSVNIEVKTQSDSVEEKYINAIIQSKNEEELNAAKAELNKISKEKWANVDQYTLSQEIEARYTDKNSGIYDSNYKKYKAILDSGTDEDIIQAARDLLITSDSIMYSDIAKEKKKELEKAGKEEEENKKEKDKNKIKELEENADGTYSLKKEITQGTANEVDLTKLDYDVTMMDRRSAWIDTNTEYHRKKTPNGFEVDSAIIKRYYSSMDAEIYFGNEYVEDIYDISWSIQQNNAPLFGYNSYTYDEVARGSRLIHGQFMINFTSPNYLFSILKAANKANTTMITNMASYNVPALSADKKPEFRMNSFGTNKRGHHNAMWPETFDIDIIFGEKSGAGDPVHIILLGVVIGNSQISLNAGPNSLTPSPGGSSVYEIYSFIAQDIKTEVLNSSFEIEDYDDTYGETYDSDEIGTYSTPVDNTNTEEEDKEAKDAKIKRDEIEKVQEKHDNVLNYMEINNGTQDISRGDNLARKGAQRTIKKNSEDSYTITFNYPNADKEETVKKLAEEDIELIEAIRIDKEQTKMYNYSEPTINKENKSYSVTITKKT